MRLILAIIILCAVARADTKITWLADVTADRAETVTGAQSNQIHDAAAHIVRSDNPHGVTAPQIGALTNETDTTALAALAAYAAYWPRNATASSWFSFVTNSGAITITGYDIEGGTDVVIPDYINGLPVTEIGANAFYESGVTSIGGAGNVVTVGGSAFYFCPSLASVSLPQVQTFGDSAFYDCPSLTSLYFDNDAPIIGAGIFADIPPNQVTNYVTNPQATGWGATLGGMPVVRLPLSADAIYQAGQLVATTQSVAEVASDLGIHTNNETIHLSPEQAGRIANAVTNETDEAALAALAAHAAYWPPNATASSWFTFTTNSGAITITGYNIGGGTDVVIPDYINGLPVTVIGASAFMERGITSIGGAGNVVTVGANAFGSCSSLTSVLLPQAQTVGDYAFYMCTSLASVSLPQVQTVGDYAFTSCNWLTSLYFNGNAPTIGAKIFLSIVPNRVKNYVTNPQATGWGATFGGMPVVRLPLYADAIYQAGELVATTGYVAQAIASQLPGEITVDQVSGAYPSSNPSNYVTSAVATNISQSLISATCSQTCIRAWMPLTTYSQYGYVDLPAASNSTVALGPAPLNSFVVRVSVPEAYSAAQFTFSNIVLYAGSHTTPSESQGFTACTTGVFTASNWNLLSPTGYLMRRDDSKMIYGNSRRDIMAYSLGMAGKVRLLCWWSPATPAELAAGTNVFYYGSDAQ